MGYDLSLWVESHVQLVTREIPPLHKGYFRSRVLWKQTYRIWSLDKSHQPHQKRMLIFAHLLSMCVLRIHNIHIWASTRSWGSTSKPYEQCQSQRSQQLEMNLGEGKRRSRNTSSAGLSHLRTTFDKCTAILVGKRDTHEWYQQGTLRAVWPSSHSRCHHNAILESQDRPWVVSGQQLLSKQSLYSE